MGNTFTTFTGNENFLADMTANDISVIVQNMMKEHRLNGGNAEIYRKYNNVIDEIHITLEAPEAPDGSSVEVVYNVKEMQKLDTDKLKKAVIEKAVHECRQFNADERFKELRQADDKYSGSELARMLKEDEEFFKKTADKMEKELNSKPTETPEEIWLNGICFPLKGETGKSLI